MRLNRISLIFLLLLASCQSRQENPYSESNIIAKDGDDEVTSWIEEVDSEVKSSESGQIPHEINERVEFWIDYFANKDHLRFQRYLNRGEKFRPMIEKVLDQHEVPRELYYLALIESGFNTSARSHAQAVGVWQFIKPTAQRYGLQVNYYNDERRDPMRATVAAAMYLVDLYRVFQSWYLAMAAYNAGESRIMNAIMRANTRDFWELASRKALPRETMNYVPKFIAASIVGRHPDRFGFTIPQGVAWPELIATPVPTRLKLKSVSKVSGIPFASLKQYNQNLLRQITPSRKSTYYLWIEKNRHHLLEGKNKQLMAARVKKMKYVASSFRSSTYRVRRGDTLASIARRHRTSISKLKRLNKLRSSRIYAGQKLKVANVKARSSQSSAKKYKVRKGDSLYSIARKFKTSVKIIKALNKIRRNRIFIGQVLKVN